MITKADLHRLIDDLSSTEVEELLAKIESRDSGEEPRTGPRPLRRDDIVLSEPVMPEDESADDLIQAVRHWRDAGGNV